MRAFVCILMPLPHSVMGWALVTEGGGGQGVITPEKSQSYQATIQYRAIIGTPAKRHLNDLPLAVRR